MRGPDPATELGISRSPSAAPAVMAPSSGYDAAQPSPELPALPPPTLDPVSYNSRTPAARLPPAQGLPPNPRAGVSHAYPPVADRNGSANGPGDSQRPAPSAQRHPTGLVDGPELREERSGAKKVNPLMDLIRTEGLYVEDLSVIIKVRCVPRLHSRADVLFSSASRLPGREPTFRRPSSTPPSAPSRPCTARTRPCCASVARPARSVTDNGSETQRHRAHARVTQGARGPPDELGA